MDTFYIKNIKLHGHMIKIVLVNKNQENVYNVYNNHNSHTKEWEIFKENVFLFNKIVKYTIQEDYAINVILDIIYTMVNVHQTIV